MTLALPCALYFVPLSKISLRELIWLKLKPELNRLGDIAGRSKGVKGERREMQEQERGAA